MIEHANDSRSLEAIERSVSAAPRHIQEALQRRRAELGLRPLRLTNPTGWTVDEALRRVERTKTAAKRWREAVAKADRARARMLLAARS